MGFMPRAVVTFSILGMLWAPSQASAKGPSYNFLEFGYLEASFEPENTNIDIRADGFGVAFNGRTSNNSYVFGNYKIYEAENLDVFNRNTGNFEKFDLERRETLFGLGLIYEVSRWTDLNFSAAYRRDRFEAERKINGAKANTSKSGYQVGVALRSRPAKILELNLGIDYFDLGKKNDIKLVFDPRAIIYSATGLFYLAPGLSLVSTYSHSDQSSVELRGYDLTHYFLGVRINF
jgi:hypothetical protein